MGLQTSIGANKRLLFVKLNDKFEIAIHCNFLCRINLCADVNGNHFEHLIKGNN